MNSRVKTYPVLVAGTGHATGRSIVIVLVSVILLGAATLPQSDS